MFKLTARLKIVDLTKQNMFKRVMSTPQDEDDHTSTASSNFDFFNEQEYIIDRFDAAQSGCSHITQNFESDDTPSCKILALKQPDYLVWRDLLLYFSKYLHSSDPKQTFSLVCPRMRITCERSIVLINQLLHSRRRWKMMKKFPFPKEVIVMMILYSKGHQIFTKKKIIEN